VTKEQIAGASNRRAKEIIKSRTGEKIFKTKTRPSDISFTKMVLFLIIGIFGTYNFYSGRRIRGFIMLVFVIVGLVCTIIFPIQFDEAGIMLSNPTRELFSSRMLPFPGDLTLALAFLIWAVDIFAVVLGFYKYPARLGEKIEVKR
jgi:CDP-diglyceride synthetase